MSGMSVFEMGMLICFAVAWPTSIYRALKTKNVENKNVIFSYIIGLGYILGMLHKIYYNWDLVIVFYIVNFLMVVYDYILYLKYRTV